jgi:hypothetical protein
VGAFQELLFQIAVGGTEPLCHFVEPFGEPGNIPFAPHLHLIVKVSAADLLGAVPEIFERQRYGAPEVEDKGDERPQRGDEDQKKVDVDAQIVPLQLVQDARHLGRVGRLELLDAPLHPLMQADQFGLKVDRQRPLLAGRMSKRKNSLGFLFHPFHVAGQALQDLRFPLREAAVREFLHDAARLRLLVPIRIVMTPVPGHDVVLNVTGERIHPALYCPEAIRCFGDPADPAGGIRKGVGNVPQ